MNDLASRAYGRFHEPHAARRAALACMVTLAVALGIGRFAFTPLLPLMLHGGAAGQPLLDIQHGGWLASANYAGYFVGAVTCAALRVSPGRMVRLGLAATVLLTLAMGLAGPFWFWALVRFVAGAVSAWTFVFASQWGLRRLAELGAHAWSGVIYTGPGVGIVGTGLLVSVAGGYGATAGWIGFGVIGSVLSALVWPVFADGARAGSGSGRMARARAASAADAKPDGAARAATAANAAGNERAAEPGNRIGNRIGNESGGQSVAPTSAPSSAHRADAFWLILLYGIPGFGYIITATFLPVIARHALPGSAWPDLFWPMFGAALIVGALLGARLPAHWDNRVLLAGCYVLQAIGIALGIVWPTAGGFSLGSILIGLPFTAITLFAMREARRLRGDDAAGLMGYATAAYGIGQIAGPLVAAPIAAHAGTFSPALWLAAGALIAGAVGLVAVARVPRERKHNRMPDCGCN
ncbi:YbfB/YjiJ family MFS transporter [Paraburkholderia sp. MMS20-SJTR3]|uniref:YbfB/YjiJ family MFS transporter n=1 Tax=Paraburkholderia sejongensis TaxID=2886946 RepID=A0ABS8JYA4_9BURK|nr:YbfB/YjiJ family MFS transporter [Paraburkholderia sp. MMS20-SJTR3]MCC8394895.1 YbfB/YjiJ family MFS transporter [Paraburkholderia sp. MMS20-SJTR3]